MKWKNLCLIVLLGATCLALGGCPLDDTTKKAQADYAKYQADVASLNTATANGVTGLQLTALQQLVANDRTAIMADLPAEQQALANTVQQQENVTSGTNTATGVSAVLGPYAPIAGTVIGIIGAIFGTGGMLSKSKVQTDATNIIASMQAALAMSPTGTIIDLGNPQVAHVVSTIQGASGQALVDKVQASLPDPPTPTTPPPAAKA